MPIPALQRPWACMLTLRVSMLLLWCTAVASQRMEKYCKMSEHHTMCQTMGIGPACGTNVIKRSFNYEDTSTIVRAHNTRRALVALGAETSGAPGPQPQASDMLEMTWDEELAMVAQRHADQCVFQHDCADCRKVDRFSVGQNLFSESRSNKVDDADWDNVVDVWYEEVNQVPNTAVSSYSFSAATGHYTQLVWGSTNKVGCGYIMYREGGWYKKLFTCNYGPAGNYIGAPMYQSGPPCSRCPDDTFCSANHIGLCDSSGTSEISTTASVPTSSASVASTYSTCLPLYSLLLGIFDIEVHFPL